jgi:hypothetical protein
MQFGFVRRKALWSLLAGAGLIGLTTMPAYGQADPPQRPAAAPRMMPPGPQTPQAPTPPAPTEPTPPTPPPSPTVDISALAPERSLAGEGATAAFAPNMIGDLLYGSRSIFFDYQSGITGPGATSITNPKVSENNSPLPRDRVYFRFNHFNDALSLTGASSQKGIDPQSGAFGFSPLTKKYDFEAYTLGGEKTFFDNLMSVELRVPFRTSLASQLTLNTATITSVDPPATPGANPRFHGFFSLDQTLGHEATEFDNLSVILKAAPYQTRRLVLSGGLGIGIPTAPDTKVIVRDFVPFTLFPNIFPVARTREFHVDNDTWSLSPYLSVLATPSDRFFTQGFLQFDFPVNNSRATFRESATEPGLRGTDVVNDPTGLGALQLALVQALQARRLGFQLPPINQSAKIDEQTLMHVDLGLGYWVTRDPEARWIRGIAPTLELHYTTTLENADVITFARDGFLKPVSANQLSQAAANLQANPSPANILNAINKIFERPPTVGNLRNRVDILDLTVGSTFLLGERATLATGFAFPLRTGDNRTFDWEFQAQFNYYFGGPRQRYAPNVMQ